MEIHVAKRSVYFRRTHVNYVIRNRIIFFCKKTRETDLSDLSEKSRKSYRASYQNNQINPLLFSNAKCFLFFTFHFITVR